MELPRILLIGKNGQVGWELRRTLAPMARVLPVDYPEIDLANPDSIRACVRAQSVDLIINAAAYTAVDKAESELELAMKINGAAPRILAEEAKHAGARLIHYSTDYVFDGNKTEPYLETDAPNPLGAYGRSKLAGDEAVRASGVAHLIFRLCWVYGARGQNFLLTIQRLAREREKLRIVADQVGCPTWSRMIAEATAFATRTFLSAGPKRHSAESINDADSLIGTYHLASQGITNWHGFTSAIVDAMPLETRKCREIEAITTSEYPTPARRPAYSVLNCEKLARTFGLRLPDWREGLNCVLEKG
jgi:dTDP-4-dehydrorhamnose reductase